MNGTELEKDVAVETAPIWVRLSIPFDLSDPEEKAVYGFLTYKKKAAKKKLVRLVLAELKKTPSHDTAMDATIKKSEKEVRRVIHEELISVMKEMNYGVNQSASIPALQPEDDVLSRKGHPVVNNAVELESDLSGELDAFIDAFGGA